jgi:protein-disulfide isomerase
MEEKETRKIKLNLKTITPFLLPGSILVAAILISGTLLFTRNQKADGQAAVAGPQRSDAPVNLKINSNDHVLGSNKAKVTMFEYSDFQCPFCRKFWTESYAKIKKDYVDTGKVRLVFRQYPLESIHPASRIAAEASECAGDLGKFWEMHDKIFEEQAKLGQNTVQFTAADLKKWAAGVGVDAGKFNSCLDSKKFAQRVTDEIKEINDLTGGIGTPTFFLSGGQKVIGAQPFEVFQQAIDPLLK